MVTPVTARVDYSTFPDGDGEPMAETNTHAIQMIDLQWALQTLFEAQGRPRVVVGGNQLMYYNERDGRDHVSPDVYVVFDRLSPAPPSWKTWIQGKFPDIVFEITSPSTVETDLSDQPGGKRRLYARLGVREYYIFDPQGEIRPPFRAYELRAGRLEAVELRPSGGIVSRLLGAELRPVTLEETARRPGGTWLRLVDPATGRLIPVAEEEHHDLAAAEQARLEAEQARLEAEQARVVAEERAARAEAALQALLAAQAHPAGLEGTSERE